MSSQGECEIVCLTPVPRIPEVDELRDLDPGRDAIMAGAPMATSLSS